MLQSDISTGSNSHSQSRDEAYTTLKLSVANEYEQISK